MRRFSVALSYVSHEWSYQRVRSTRKSWTDDYCSITHGQWLETEKENLENKFKEFLIVYQQFNVQLNYNVLYVEFTALRFGIEASVLSLFGQSVG